MMLRFSNPSRSFDATKDCVKFWGYDSAIEVVFFVKASALKKLCPEVITVEAGFLEAFDSAKKRIHEAAEEIYVRGRNSPYAYILGAEDF